MIDINYGPYPKYDPKLKYNREFDMRLNDFSINNTFDAITWDRPYISFDEDFKERKDNENEI